AVDVPEVAALSALGEHGERLHRNKAAFRRTEMAVDTGGNDLARPRKLAAALFIRIGFHNRYLPYAKYNPTRSRIRFMLSRSGIRPRTRISPTPMLAREFRLPSKRSLA